MPAGAAPTFAVNGTNAAKNDTVTFQRAGNYTFTVTITNAAGLSTTSRVNRPVNQTAHKHHRLAGNGCSLIEGGTKHSPPTPYDQFGQALAIQPTFTWSVRFGRRGSGERSDPATGLYAARVGNPVPTRSPSPAARSPPWRPWW